MCNQSADAGSTWVPALPGLEFVTTAAFRDDGSLLLATQSEILSTASGFPECTGLPAFIAPLELVSTPEGGFLAAFANAIHQSDNGAAPR